MEFILKKSVRNFNLILERLKSEIHKFYILNDVTLHHLRIHCPPPQCCAASRYCMLPYIPDGRPFTKLFSYYMITKSKSKFLLYIRYINIIIKTTVTNRENIVFYPGHPWARIQDFIQVSNYRQKGWVNNRSVGNQKIITQTLHKSVQKIITQTTPKSVSKSWQAKITWVIPPVPTRLLPFTDAHCQPTPLITRLRPQEGSESGQLSARGVEPTQTPTAALQT